MPSPQLQQLIDFMRPMRLEAGDLHVQRKALELSATDAPPEGFTASRDTIGGVDCEWLIADGEGYAEGPILLYLHGGAYNLGSLATHRLFVAEYGRAAGGRVLLVDYRLAPEHPFPAALDDALAVYRELLARSTPPGQIVLIGDSAGGGLAVATALAVRDQGLDQPAGIVSVSGWLDLRCESTSYETAKDLDPMLTRDGLVQMAGRYLGDTPAEHPYASPGLADLSGLAPMHLQVGTAELLLDDTLLLHERAREAGVEAELVVGEGMPHVWTSAHSFLPEAREALDQMAAFVRSVTSEG